MITRQQTPSKNARTPRNNKEKGGNDAPKKPRKRKNSANEGQTEPQTPTVEKPKAKPKVRTVI